MARTNAEILNEARDRDPDKFRKVVAEEREKSFSSLVISYRRKLLEQYDNQIDGNGEPWAPYAPYASTPYFRDKAIKRGSYKRGPKRIKAEISGGVTHFGPLLVLSGETRKVIKNKSAIYTKDKGIKVLEERDERGFLGIDDNTMKLIDYQAMQGRDCSTLDSAMFVTIVVSEVASFVNRAVERLRQD